MFTVVKFCRHRAVACRGKSKGQGRGALQQTIAPHINTRLQMSIKISPAETCSL